jgi:hypothetical protein
MTLNNSSVIGNGVGIRAGSKVVLNNSSISGNSPGGGILVFDDFILNNSTVSGNSNLNDNFGGGIYIQTVGNPNININNSTITENLGSYGGGIYVSDNFAPVTMQNSIIANNTADTGPDCYGFGNGMVESLGYNIIGNTSNCQISSFMGDLLDVDPLLDPLQDNGGPTFTHALLLGSPAIDAGNPAGCTDQDGSLLTTDQRGVSRPQGVACDIGSFELEVLMFDVDIDIKPGSETNPINTRSKGKIPVAILSTVDFAAPSMVDTISLTFGKTGDEVSLALCNNEDINADGLADLMCHFYTQFTGFQVGDTEGILKGQTIDGIPIEGFDSVNILK